jgi:hypothetical protein
MALGKDPGKKGEKPRYGLKRTPLKRVSAKRAAANKEYSQVIEIYKRNNPHCCGCGAQASDFHHICRGPDRAATLTNTDLGMNGCRPCHTLWDDKGKCPVERQFAIKFASILRQYNLIATRKLSMQEVVDHLQQEI